MNHNYPEHIVKKLRELDGLDEDNNSKDTEFQEMSPQEVFDAVLRYEGIIGYGFTILSLIEDIFKVRLIVDYEEQPREDFLQGLLNILIAQNLNDAIAYQMADVICDTAKTVQNQ